MPVFTLALPGQDGPLLVLGEAGLHAVRAEARCGSRERPRATGPQRMRDRRSAARREAFELLTYPPPSDSIATLDALAEGEGARSRLGLEARAAHPRAVGPAYRDRPVQPSLEPLVLVDPVQVFALEDRVLLLRLEAHAAGELGVLGVGIVDRAIGLPEGEKLARIGVEFREAHVGENRLLARLVDLGARGLELEVRLAPQRRPYASSS